MFVNQELGSESNYDAVLIGAGVMSCTLAVLLNELDPDMRVLVVEKLHSPGLESSFALNNAGTGHAANCELNYTPVNVDGEIQVQKALEINRSFERSLEFWASMTSLGKLSPKNFLNFLPHISFVEGESDVDFLKERYEKLSRFEAFSEMDWSEDKKELQEWMPLVLEGRATNSPIAGTRIKRGTDLDFGELSIRYMNSLKNSSSVQIEFSTEVIDLRKDNKNTWNLTLKGSSEMRDVRTPFVFIGAGGGALTLLQKSKIPEGESYGGFPVSGQWLVCDKSDIAKRHSAKVYGKASFDSPPMAVPHLDTRWIKGKRSLLFGPFAGFSTKFLKNGSKLDLFGSITKTNIFSLIQAGLKNIDLVKYLINQLTQDHEERVDVLRKFIPLVDKDDWELYQAGQRVQIIKNSSQGGILKMGTEVVCSADGSLAALLGASPGASTAVTTMIEVLNRCFAEKMTTVAWQEKLKLLFPSLSKSSQKDSDSLRNLRDRNDSILGFSQSL